MTFPVVINGNTYNNVDFQGRGYLSSFPAIINDVATVAGVVSANSVNSTAQATTATTQAGIATTARTAAEVARDAAQAAAVGTQFAGYTTTGTSTLYTITDANLLIVANASIKVRFDKNSAANPTLRNTSAGVAKPLLYQTGQPIAAGILKANQSYILLFDGALDGWKVQGLSADLIQRAEAIFPIGSQVVAINPTRLQATPYAPLYLAGALVGNVAEAVYQIATDAAFANIVHTITRTVAPFDNVPYNIGVLNVATTYYWRVRYQDTKGNQSEFSAGGVFVTAASFLFDMLAFQHAAATTSPADNRLLTVYDKDVNTYTRQNLIAVGDLITGGAINCLEWSPNGRFLLAGGSFTNGMRIYDYDNGTPVVIALPAWLVTKLGANQVFVIKINKAGTRIFIGGGFTQNAICAAWSNAGIGAEILLPTPPTGAGVYGADFSFDNDYLVFTTTSNGAAQQNSYIHTYAWRNSIGDPLADPIRLANVGSQQAASYFGVCFHARYNQYYVGNSSSTVNCAVAYRIASDNAQSHIGSLASLPSGQSYSLAVNVAGTRLYVQHSVDERVLSYNINGANATHVPAYIGISAAQLVRNNARANILSVDPTNGHLAAAPSAFPLGAKPRLFDVSADAFTDISNTVPFAYFPDTGTYGTDAVAFRFGRYGYPV